MGRKGIFMLEDNVMILQIAYCLVGDCGLFDLHTRIAMVVDTYNQLHKLVSDDLEDEEPKIC